MASTRSQISMSSFSSSNLLSSLLILLAIHPCSLSARPQQAPTSTDPSAAIPSLVNDPTDGDTPLSFTPSSASSSSAIPSATDSAGYGNNNNNNNNNTNDTTTSSSSPHTGILNYYFLLLAVFVIAILVIYWTLARRRRKAAAKLTRMQQSVLSEDVRSWTRHRQAGYGFADEERGRTMVSGRGGMEEGLDEAGEAPPAYVKVPDRVHLGRGGEEEEEGVELRGMGVKPPEYEEGRT